VRDLAVKDHRDPVLGIIDGVAAKFREFQAAFI